MKEYNDTDLSLLISAGKVATLELCLIKSRIQTRRIKELLAFRRGQLNLIRRRATELNLTGTDYDNIHAYVNERSISSAPKYEMWKS